MNTWCWYWLHIYWSLMSTKAHEFWVPKSQVYGVRHWMASSCATSSRFRIFRRSGSAGIPRILAAAVWTRLSLQDGKHQSKRRKIQMYRQHHLRRLCAAIRTLVCYLKDAKQTSSEVCNLSEICKSAILTCQQLLKERSVDLKFVGRQRSLPLRVLLVDDLARNRGYHYECCWPRIQRKIVSRVAEVRCEGAQSAANRQRPIFRTGSETLASFRKNV